MSMVEWKNIENCIVSLKTGLNPRQNFKLNLAGNSLPYITGKDIYANKINISPNTDKIDSNAVSLINKRACLESNILLFASTGTGTVGRMAIIEDYNNDWAISETLYAIKTSVEIKPQFLMHVLYSDVAKKQFEPKISKGSVPHLKIADLMKVSIPVPTLSEQTRIVGILDTFTASIDNLQEQIAQRRKQYEFYRDQLFYASKADLLEASKRGEVIVKSLDDLGTFTRGRRFVRTDIVPEGVPCIHYGDMYTYYGVSAEETPTHLTKELSSKLRFAKNGDVVIVAAGENDLDIGVGVAWLGKEPVVVHDACFIFENKMNPKYLSHFMRSRNYHQQIRMGVVDGKICSISAKELGRALIAVPSLQEQQRIVSILDTFEASIQNLEAQLSQREKQYDYYRNKLLTFE